MKNYYQVLGVSPNCTDIELKKAYYEKARKCNHIDNNPNDGGELKRLTEAYKVLSNPDKRTQYDEQVMREAPEAASRMNFPFNIDLNSFFDRANPERRSKDSIFNLGVSLEELYKGAVRKIATPVNVVCNACQGKGGKNVEKCTRCMGSGDLVWQQSGPNFNRIIKETCLQCGGHGCFISRTDRCTTCNGRKVTCSENTLEVHVKKGMRGGDKITLHGQGNQEPGRTPGNVVFVLEEKAHNVFTRKGDTLFMIMKVSLGETIGGYQKVITTLDGRSLEIAGPPGEIVKHKSTKSIPNEGMPRTRNPSEKGTMVIVFLVDIPEKIDPAIRAILK